MFGYNHHDWTPLFMRSARSESTAKQFRYPRLTVHEHSHISDMNESNDSQEDDFAYAKLLNIDVLIKESDCYYIKTSKKNFWKNNIMTSLF